jgi:CPA2 family monovalent cation:H+ antiporter-2
VILLTFGVGLHVHLGEWLAVRRIADPEAVFGMARSVASTVVLTRVLADGNELHTQVGHIGIGWLVVEDLFAVVIRVLLPALFGARAVGWGGPPPGG